MELFYRYKEINLFAKSRKRTYKKEFFSKFIGTPRKKNNPFTYKSLFFPLFIGKFGDSIEND